jgi:DNA (cytosine-5)-methyltransferase 1
MTHGSLFSGIGGFELAAEWMGWENKFHCEWNDFGQKVLHYYWPESEQFTDIKKTNFKKYEGTIDIISGGFPCQPYSTAGKRLGKNDKRHLWPEMLRAIREINPTYIVGENVWGLLNWNRGLVFNEICSELEDNGYQVAPCLIPACGVGAPHQRQRIWFVAYSEHNRKKKNRGTIKNEEREIWGEKEGNVFGGYYENGNATNSKCVEGWEQIHFLRNGRIQELDKKTYWERFPTEYPICSGDDGISTKLDGITFPKWRNETMKGYGNAIVPQVALQIFKAIEQYDKAHGFKP